MPELFLSIYFAYKNSLIAKAKGLNTVLWVFVTILAFIVAYAVGALLVVGLFYKGGPNPDEVKEFLFTHPLHVVFVWFSAIGGCLFIRYILENKPGITPDNSEEGEEKGEM